MTTAPKHWGHDKGMVSTRCREPVDPPTTIEQLLELMENAVDESVLTQRLGWVDR